MPDSLSGKHRPDSNLSPLTGILIYCLAWQIVPIMDAIVKYMGHWYPVAQLVWARFFFHFLFVLPVVLYRFGPTAFRVPKVGLQILRGGLLFAATVLFFFAIQYIPLANAIALVFVAPIIVTLLSPVLLRERVTPSRWAAVIIGFIAVLIIVRPGLQGFHWASLLVLGTALFFGLYLLSTRALAGTAPPMVTLVYQSILGMVVSSAVLPFVWVTPTLNHFLMMVSLGAIAATGHFLIIKAFEYADASLLASFNYSEILMATLLGYFVFGDLPDSWTWVGIAMIILSAIYISLPHRPNKTHG